MQRRQVHVRVRTGSGEVIEALVLEWLSYPDRALVQLPSRQRPSVVRLNPATHLYAPRSLPAPTPQLAVVLAGLLIGGVLLGLLVPTSPPARPAESVPALSLTPSPPPAPKPSAPQAQPSTSLPPADWTAPRHTVRPKPATAAALPPAHVAQAPPLAKPSAPSRARYEARLTALSVGESRHGAHTCKCGATFDSARDLEAHQTSVVYSCIRYPACQVTADNPEAILKHYEKERDAGGRCWFESVRFGSSYAVVKRPKCRPLAADPNHRKVIKVRVRPNVLDDTNPWR